jgi:predicted nucleic acid-binding protein
MNALDTNVLVYAVSALDGHKEKAAKKILARAVNAGWSVPAQVYGEFFAVMTRRQYMTRKEARAAIEAFSAVMPAMPSTVTAHVAALKLAAERQVQYWDALIIAVCAEHGVTHLYTEDTPSAATLLGVKCVSPFAVK